MRRQEHNQEDVEQGAYRAAWLGCSGVLIVGGLGLGVLARGPLERLGTGKTDTSDVGLVFAALPLLALAVFFVAYGMRLDRPLREAPKWRWAAAVLLVGVFAPFDQLGTYGLAINLAVESATMAVLYAARSDGRSVDVP